MGPVILLLLLFTVNQWARSLLFYVVDFSKPLTEETARLFMNVDVGFDESQYGILASVGDTASPCRPFSRLAPLLAPLSLLRVSGS